ncbi:ribosome biogenesis GTP-binding protein YihA/YsxC [Maridesulfovibrio ferrireducens]|uniref:ribosome biogenesis GTP-binding protein YihA/YsxC n=1 Tax=Maridesulfovibrio ferrireducens TaxID=246191 RepID=UPI001A337939|nr:ribosome biogenesis GTP-binding protein YihA/YsxC [Maridesulfovibrio ferrireducens]MBI9111469.1 YihA family ribosome biogenesis GTP-binding protein [Maridesulfovibrio ferrireducens]
MNNTLKLMQTVYEIDQLEQLPVPQIILAGRSNVGKSSLVNCLAERKKLAKISATPGKTRSLNYYEVVPHGYYIVDLPGYGYAKCSKTERAKWGTLIDRYLEGNAYVAAAVVLLDSRLTPQKNDIDMISYFRQCNIPILPVLTKSDKTKQGERAKIQNKWQDILHVKPLCVSSKSGMNRTKLWNLLDKTAMPELAHAPVSIEDVESNTNE